MKLVLGILLFFAAPILGIIDLARTYKDSDKRTKSEIERDQEKLRIEREITSKYADQIRELYSKPFLEVGMECREYFTNERYLILKMANGILTDNHNKIIGLDFDKIAFPGEENMWMETKNIETGEIKYLAQACVKRENPETGELETQLRYIEDCNAKKDKIVMECVKAGGGVMNDYYVYYLRTGHFFNRGVY